MLSLPTQDALHPKTERLIRALDAFFPTFRAMAPFLQRHEMAFGCDVDTVLHPCLNGLSAHDVLTRRTGRNALQQATNTLVDAVKAHHPINLRLTLHPHSTAKIPRGSLIVEAGMFSWSADTPIGLTKALVTLNRLNLVDALFENRPQSHHTLLDARSYNENVWYEHTKACNAAHATLRMLALERLTGWPKGAAKGTYPKTGDAPPNDDDWLSTAKTLLNLLNLTPNWKT